MFDTNFQDALVICMFDKIAISHSSMGHGTNRQWHITLHMHGDIALNGCECMINESNQH